MVVSLDWIYSINQVSKHQEGDPNLAIVMCHEIKKTERVYCTDYKDLFPV